MFSWRLTENDLTAAVTSLSFVKQQGSLRMNPIRAHSINFVKLVVWMVLIVPWLSKLQKNKKITRFTCTRMKIPSDCD